MLNGIVYVNEIIKWFKYINILYISKINKIKLNFNPNFSKTKSKTLITKLYKKI